MKSSAIRRYSSWWRFHRTRTERWGWPDRTESITFRAFGRKWHIYNRKDAERARLRQQVYDLRAEHKTFREIGAILDISPQMASTLFKEAMQ